MPSAYDRPLISSPSRDLGRHRCAPLDTFIPEPGAGPKPIWRTTDEVIGLDFGRELPEVGFKRMVDFDAPQANLRHPAIEIPLIERHETEHEFQHFLAANV